MWLSVGEMKTEGKSAVWSPANPQTESKNNSTKDILNKIQQAFESQKNRVDNQGPQEKFFAFLKIMKMYFDLGQEVTRNGQTKIPEQLSELSLKTGQDLANNAFEIQQFIQRFRNKCLSYGEDCSPLSNCVIMSGLEYMFKIYPESMFLENEDCELEEVLNEIKEEADYLGFLDDFKDWWDSECYIDPMDIPTVTCTMHWWWDC